MQSRVVLKEIPAGKFHSVIFTSYSFSLYFFEQQVLPMLGSKGIHYISLLVDGDMLDSELTSYGLFSENKKRSYSIHGMQANGAFHPKLIFLAGPASLCVLIGSGNLTSSGHGKNLESWNAVYVENEEDEKLGFIIQCWTYLKKIHEGLGKNAVRKIKTIEENCSLLNNINYGFYKDYYKMNETAGTISFISTLPGLPLFRQVSRLIKDDSIHSITVMCPYYDSEGKLLHLLNKTFNPSRINVFLQREFGAAPLNMNALPNMQYFDWEANKVKDIKQSIFHAKNIIFEGKKYNYLLSGSANASIAAFGNDAVDGINQEACILYREKDADYLSMLGLKLKNNTIKLTDIKKRPAETGITGPSSLQVFIREVEKNYDTIALCCVAAKPIKNIRICLFNSKGHCEAEILMDINSGETENSFKIAPGMHIMSTCLFLGNTLVSNRQFVIDANAFEAANPSPANRSLNEIRKLIEGGVFSTSKIIEYLSTIYKQHGKRGASRGSLKEEKSEGQKLMEGDNVNLYLSYEEIQEEIKRLDRKEKERVYIEYKSVRIWDSIVSYLRENRRVEEEAGIDEEETENIDMSRGREDRKINKRKPISKSNHERLKQKTEKFIENYWSVLESKLSDLKSAKPNLVDLSMYLILIEMLLHLAGYREAIEDSNVSGKSEREHLLGLPFSEITYSWSEFVLKLTGLFTLWCSQRSGFEYGEADETKEKMKLYKHMAFKSSLTALSLLHFANQSKTNEKMKLLWNTSLLNVNRIFNDENSPYYDLKEFKEFIPLETKEYVGEQVIDEFLSMAMITTDSLKQQSSFSRINDVYLHPTDGYCYILNIIPYAQDRNIKFLKLINAGYNWDEGLRNYWNGKFYFPENNRWMPGLQTIEF